mmetsp:Transcript_28440/g.61828  ORF Transcript_28440/g.61828 Transcript_28440/m.61828 type:complete len:246 (-) Transcript_28440:660-1397(-)
MSQTRLVLTLQCVLDLVQAESSDGEQVVAHVVVEVEGDGDAALESRIGLEKLVHLFLVACENDDDLFSLVFHLFDQCVHSLHTEAVLPPSLNDGVGLVDEEDSTECLLDRPNGLQGRVPDVLADEVAPGTLVEVELRERGLRVNFLRVEAATRNMRTFFRLHGAHFEEHLTDKSGDNGLACSRVSHKLHVEGLLGDGAEVEVFPELGEAHQRVELLHHSLDLRETDEFVEFCEDLSNGAGGLIHG